MGKRELMRLSATGVKNQKKAGYHADGGGLYLQVSKTGSKSWIFRYMFNKRSREMGLGPWPTFTLAEARERANACRKLLADDKDPLDQRQADREKEQLAAAQRRTFEECAHEYHKLHASGWKNTKHANQWINTLTAHAFPAFGSKDVSDVSKADILSALQPIWTAMPETASRVRQRIRSVLDWSAARDYRRDHDPHLWDQLAKSLPKTKSIKKVKNFAACPYPNVFDALQSIKNSTASDSLKHAFEFIILTAARSGEVRNAKWSEIDLQLKHRRIAAEDMKMQKEHRIPLSVRAIEILKAQEGKDATLIFPSDKGKPFSDMAFTMLLRRLGYDFTVHGFRSTFRDWAAEQTAYPSEVIEHALAHNLKDKTEAAYFRSDLFEKRRQLMDDWADYCATEKKTVEVVGLDENRKK